MNDKTIIKCYLIDYSIQYEAMGANTPEELYLLNEIYKNIHK
jgi:hypothetical protein